MFSITTGNKQEQKMGEVNNIKPICAIDELVPTAIRCYPILPHLIIQSEFVIISDYSSKMLAVVYILFLFFPVQQPVVNVILWDSYSGLKFHFEIVSTEECIDKIGCYILIKIAQPPVMKQSNLGYSFLVAPAACWACIWSWVLLICQLIYQPIPGASVHLPRPQLAPISARRRCNQWFSKLPYQQSYLPVHPYSSRSSLNCSNRFWQCQQTLRILFHEAGWCTRPNMCGIQGCSSHPCRSPHTRSLRTHPYHSKSQLLSHIASPHWSGSTGR